MDLKKEIERLLESLKMMGHSRSHIEDRLGYSENAIDQGLSRGATEKMYKAIKLYHEWAVLKNATPQPLEGHDSPGMIEEVRISFDRLTSAIGQLTGLRREEILPSSQPYTLDRIAAFYNLRQGGKKKSAGK